MAIDMDKNLDKIAVALNQPAVRLALPLENIADVDGALRALAAELAELRELKKGAEAGKRQQG
jgi:hypothetical protein